MLQYIITGLLLGMNMIYAASAVTYEFSGGRFGDNLLSYLHAKWISHEAQIPLLYRPFNFSSKLLLDDKELSYEKEWRNYRKEVALCSNIPRPIDMSWLFVCPYFPECQWELNRGKYFTFKPDWKDPVFRKIVREMISLKEPLSVAIPPRGVITVAMHIRDGGSFDDYEHHFKHPLKTPPVSYYCESILKIMDLVKGHPIYCHVFTDALNPQALVDQIENVIPPGSEIVFNYRRENNHDTANVLEDFFSFFNFDVLIRAQSNYSIVPALIHNFAVVCSPIEYSIEHKTVTIDEILMEVDEKLLQKCLGK